MAQVATLDIQGMSCASCVARAERVLRAGPGVQAASVNLALQSAQVVFDAPSTAQDLAAALTRAGYAATPRAADAPPAPPLHSDEPIWARALLAAALTLPVFAVEMGGHLWPALHHARSAVLGDASWAWAQLALIGAVLAGPGRGFFLLGLPSLWRLAPDMNALVALGAGAAFGYSAWVTLAGQGGPVYFESAGVTVTLILMGRALEARAKGAAGAAIARLVQLQPQTAQRIGPGGAAAVPIAALLPGDQILVAPGARIAADGRVLAGQSQIDTAMLTGEAMPVPVAPGDAVTAGCVNGAGALTVQVTAVGADSVLARITQMVEQAQAGKLPIQSQVDRVTQWFVPLVMALAVASLLGWLVAGAGLGAALIHAVSVLIIACPCAMGLAVPVSILVGTGRGAQLGVLFRGGAALQRLAGVRAVAFDKTGTLTLGRPRVVASLDHGGALALAAGVEAASHHPLARAILDHAEGQGVAAQAVADVVAVAGQGAQGWVAGDLVQVGSSAMMGALPDDIAAFADAAAAQGQGLVFVARAGAVIGAFAVEDTIKPQAAAALARLRAQGLTLRMLTGDSAAVALRVGAALGLSDAEISAQMMPQDKAQAMAALAGPCAFVGDGINDAPALARADVGISMGNGSDVAIEAGDVVLIGGDLGGVARAIGLSRAVMRNIAQNLFWAFAYNAALIPVAMGALVPLGGPALSPMLAALAMAASSIFVITNALRLRRFGG